jgi:hypothetical protein
VPPPGGSAPRTLIDGSPTAGKLDALPEIVFVARRMTEPPMQPRPSSTIVAGNESVPWKKRHVAPVIDSATSVNESAETLGKPVARRSAPLGKTEFGQPCAVAVAFAHGHAAALPSPAQPSVHESRAT